MPAKINIVGDKYHRLIVLKESGRDLRNRNLYDCLCDCGNVVNVLGASLRSGNTKSCGCLHQEVRTKHGKHNTLVYRRWRGMLTRCYNPEHDSYQYYGGRGVTVSDSFIDSFLAFYEEIGDPPDDSPKWTVDRIDPNYGYIKGNIRWATATQQARNKRLPKNNVSGYNGVSKITYLSGNSAWVATWYDIEGCSRSKAFNIAKLGNDVALYLAATYREQKILELNEKGAGYSEHHGKSH